MNTIVDTASVKNLDLLIETFTRWAKQKKSGEIRVVLQDGGLRNIVREYEKEVIQPTK